MKVTCCPRTQSIRATGAAEERGSRVADTLEVPVEELERVWITGLARALGWDEAA